MPKGVEHPVLAPIGGVQRVTAIEAVMPKGVEHRITRNGKPL